MRQSQSKDLKLFGTLVTRSNPSARSQSRQTAAQSASKIDTGLNAAGTALQLARDAGEAATNVPYVIKVREEIQANKERCEEIINLSDLEDYANFLQNVLQDELQPWKKQSQWISYINRGKNAGDLQKLEHELDEFQNRFFARPLICLVKRQGAMSIDARTAVTLLSKSYVHSNI
ncbi:hypothetical protein DL96DRAFT_1624112 [Flagelloscypha sp. PMI_526]|nr:hypothetical protein DL96DRAFT_1624112 [Flagelloscypha sp. PMI_526]